jgi:hypothetical protein
MVGTALLAVEDLPIGEALPIGQGEELRLAAILRWADFRGGRDPSRPLFFAGISTAIVGIAVMMSFVRVDSAVFVEGERLVVALRPQRLAPLYGERFAQLCKEWVA